MCGAIFSPEQVVYDVEANVGEFALAASHVVGSKGAVLAAEPDPFLFGLIHRTMAEPGNAGLQLEALSAAIAEKGWLFFLSDCQAGTRVKFMYRTPA